MSLRDLLKKGAQVAADFGREAASEELQRRFPGFTHQVFKQGWLPVPESALEAGLGKLAVEVDELETIRLRCVPGQFHVEVDTRAYWVLKNRLSVCITITDFTLNSARQVARMRCNEDVQVEGRSLVGRLALGLVEGFLQRALRCEDTGAKLESVSEGMVSLNWPDIDIDLAKIPQVRRVKEMTFLGVGVLDLVELGPVSVEDKHARLRVRWKAED